MIFATNSAVIYGWAEMLTPAYGELAQQFNIVKDPSFFVHRSLLQSYGTVNGQFGWTFVILSFFALVTNGLGVKYGKRPVFLASNIITIASSIGSAYSTTWAGLLASQLIGSLGRAPYETLVAGVVADLYLLLLSLSNDEVLCPSTRSSLCFMDSCHCRQFFGLRYCLRIRYSVHGLACDIQNLYSPAKPLAYKGLTAGSGALGASTLLFFFFCPETNYRRPASSNIDLTGTVAGPSLEDARPPSANLDEKGGYQTTPGNPLPIDEKWDEAPLSFSERIKVYRGVESADSLLAIIFRPIPLSLLPPVLFSFVAGLSWSWLSVLFGITALIYGSAPYNFSVFQIGLLFIGGVAVSILAFVSGPLSDWTCKFLARHNRGIYEPEVSRMPFLVRD
jgi:hypothetical protein